MIVRARCWSSSLPLWTARSPNDAFCCGGACACGLQANGMWWRALTTRASVLPMLTKIRFMTLLLAVDVGKPRRLSDRRDRVNRRWQSCCCAFTTLRVGACFWASAMCAISRSMNCVHASRMVPQKAWLFSGTVAEQSARRLARCDRGADAPCARCCPKPVCLRSRTRARCGGGPGGTNFSGGQRQRLAIARAIIKPADLYIFDDSFSALDFKTDAALRAALTQEMRDSALLIIAQRISTILHADQIIVLKDGEGCGPGAPRGAYGNV